MWDLTARRKGSPDLHLKWPARGSRRSAQQRRLDYLKHPSYSIGNGRVEMMIYRDPTPVGEWCEDHLELFFFYFPEIRAWLDEHGCEAKQGFVGSLPCNSCILINGPLDAVMRVRDRIMDYLHDFGPMFRARDAHAAKLAFVGNDRKFRRIAAHFYKEADALFDEYWPHKYELREETIPLFSDGMTLADPPYGKVGEFLRVTQAPIGIRLRIVLVDDKIGNASLGTLMARSKFDIGLARLFGL